MLHPDDTFTLHPDGEGEDKPQLVYKMGSCQYWIDYLRRYDAIAEAGGVELNEKMLELAEENLLDMRNVNGASKLGEAFTLADVRMIAAGKCGESVGADLKKKSNASSLSLTDNSPAVATAAGA